MKKFLPCATGISRVVLLFSLAWCCGHESFSSDSNSLASPAVGDRELKILTPTLLELTLVTTKQPDPEPVTTWNFVGPNFTPAFPILSEFDVRIDGAPVAVAEVGFKRRPLYAPLKVRDLRIGNWIYLRLGAPISEGQTVVVQNVSGKLWTNGQYSAVASSVRLNPAIHVNQVGGERVDDVAGWLIGRNQRIKSFRLDAGADDEHAARTLGA